MARALTNAAGIGLLGASLALACSCRRSADGDNAVEENTNVVSREALAPRLLHDEREIARYLAAFPSEAYKLVDVPKLGRFYLDDNPGLVKVALRAKRPWEPAVARVLAQGARPGTTALDIGAHIGTHTLALARAVGARGRVYAFEPQRKVYRELVRNLALNRIENVVPLRFAVGNETRVVEMNPGVGPDGAIGVGHGGDRAELRPIDSFPFANVSLIKIDVEGFELEVLRGAARTIKRWRPVIVTEIGGAHIYNLLPPAKKALVDGVRGFLKHAGYSLGLIEIGGEPQFLALPARHPLAKTKQ